MVVMGLLKSHFAYAPHMCTSRIMQDAVMYDHARHVNKSLGFPHDTLVMNPGRRKSGGL